nr:polyprotein [Feline picornavirus]
MAFKFTSSNPTTEVHRARGIFHVFYTQGRTCTYTRVTPSALKQRGRAYNVGLAMSTNSTGNKPQVAQAGGNVYQINYYGSDYAVAKGEATTQMDPEKFTRPVADILASKGTALKSPTVEECGFSDRIMQITSGNSTITTQEAVNAVVAYGCWPSFDSGAGEAIDKLTDPGPSVDRFYTLDSIEWSTTTQGYYYNLPGCLTNLGMFGQNCAYHYLMRSGFCVHIQVNASKFHQGTLMIVAVPECQFPGEPSAEFGVIPDELRTEFWKQYPRSQLTIFPHQFINLRTNNSSTLILPYVNATPAENALTHSYWTLLLVPLVPLEYSSGATTRIPVTISIAPMCSSFSGLRNRIPIPQGIPTFQVPGSEQFVTTLRNPGYPLYPEYQKTPPHHIPGRVTNLMEVAEVDTLCNLSDNEVLYINATGSAPLGQNLGTWDLSLQGNLLSPTYLGRLSRFYTHYRGSINLTFMFCGSAMATGKFLISYTPPGGDAPRTRQDAMLATHVVWDVGLQSSCSLVIPYISQSQYRFSNISGNKLSYDGYITLWYQTAVVTPPNCPNQCALVCFASACKDFEMRLPVDSAYFQGLGDDLSKVITSVTKDITQPLMEPVTGTVASLPQQLSLQVGDGSALAAPETGVSATTEPEQMMETRVSPVLYSKYETGVEYFMSRYAKFSQIELKRASVYHDRIPLYFNDTRATQRAIRTKYRMFTYVRCDYDVVLLASTNRVDGSNTENQVNTDHEFKLQAMFCPPGSPQPSNFDSPEWACPTNPSIYFRLKAAPASFRIPFMGISSAYASFYNGYSTFTPQASKYGEFPGNYLGDLWVRLVADNSRPGSASTVVVNVQAFCRPVNFEGYLPRPIVSLKPNVRVGPSRGRVEFVETGDPMEIGTGPFGADVRPLNAGPRRSGLIPNRMERTYEKVWLAHHPKGFTFNVVPLHSDIVLIPFHLFSTNLMFSHGAVYHFSEYKPVWMSMTYDVAVLKLEKPTFHCSPPICLHGCKSGWLKCVTREICMSMKVQGFDLDTLEVGETEWVGAHTQRGLISSQGPVPYGSCGSPVICEHGVCAITTATNRKQSFFTKISEIPYFQAMEQGPGDWLAGIFENMGGAFGEGLIQPIKERLDDIRANLTPSTIRSDLTKTTITTLVKIICAMVLISKAYDKVETAALVGTMLGVDFLSKDPFEWLKERIVGPQEQGWASDVSNWIKEFNAACTAAKGLEWIGQRLSQFVDWVKSFFKKEDKRRTHFIKGLEKLPMLMETFDKISTSRGQYGPETVKRVCTAFRELKRGADIYGGERNFATGQILSYYKRAMAMLKSMSSGRTEPVAILIHGGPGKGKSLITETMGRQICKAMGSSLPYSLPPDPKYFDGYTQQPVVIMDDVGQNPDGEDLKLFCQMVSSTEFQVPMADLEDKGLLFTSPYVLATTNCDRLAPPTIAEPKALERRFVFDLDIHLEKEYTDRAGRLSADEALTQCSHPATNFKRCCPLICGKAVKLRDRKSGITYSVDDLLTCLYRESARRQRCGDKLDALFQGVEDEVKMLPDAYRQKMKVKHQIHEGDLGFERVEMVPDPEEWFETDWDKMPHILKTIDEQVKEGIIQDKPMPNEVADLLRALRGDEKVVKYCQEQGWVLPPDLTQIRVERDVKITIDQVATGLSILASIATLASFIYLAYRIFASRQGPYSGESPAPLKAPVPRRVVVTQGPDSEFALKLMSTNLLDVLTAKGHFSGLAVCDTWILLPMHSDPGDVVSVEGKEMDVLERVDLNNEQGALELTLIRVNRPTKFRDIRKFFPPAFSAERDCTLVVNNKNFPRVMLPVGAVTAFGFLSLSFLPRYNTCTYRYPTKMGQCGGVVLKAGKIVAMHIGGDGLNGYGAILTRRHFAFMEGAIVSTSQAPRPINLNTRTTLRPSVFYDTFKGEKEPAALHVKDKRLEVDLEKAMFSKYKGNLDIEFPPELSLAVDQYVEQIRPLMPPDLTEPLPLEDVVYGIDNLEGLDLNTSAGYPYVTMGVKKKDLIPERGQSLSPLIEALDIHGYGHPYVTYLKDELRPIEKVKLGKTRLIECSSLNDTIRFKTVFGRFMQVYHRNPGTITGCAVGCNPDEHWSQFYHEFKQEPIMAFDYSNYDASLHPLWFDALKMIFRKLGYSEEDLGLIDHVCFSKHIYKSTLYEVEGGMPSGCSGTSILNSIINNLIIKTLVLRTYKGVDLDQLKILAYGDDVIVTYPFQLDASIVAEEGKLFGLTMTPPDKTSTFNETTWDTVTFLKRRFVPDHQFPFLIHPVFPMSEIYESIRWTRNPQQTNEHVDSLCRLAWHCGEEEYNDFIAKVRTVPVGRALSLPTYRVLRAFWLDLF